jgi:5-methylcytosine-specific restriction protein B
MEFPLNTILYGPPGTGKTYNTILRAAQIIENRTIDSYGEALDIFKANLHNQIEFITFHQNYSYEDFIQGLRPETDNKSSLVFDKKDGVFKKIADKALENLKLVQKAPEELTSEAKFDKALELFSDKVLENEDNFKINDTAYIFEVEDDAFRYTGGKWTNHTNGLRMKFSDLREFYRNKVESRKDVKKLTSISGLANQHATYYFLVYSEILKLLPKKAEEPQKVTRKNYVIIIDEINRANISRVFGELITLIEPDKRSHGTIPLEARLPSGDPFIVPSNLFIIGTMNTADKSIALLDIALRRRFEFKSMYPKYEITGQEIYDVEILKKINEQIIKSKGHDFQIGHAYFMGENKDLVQRMNKKVIPLLLEYYMNDEKEVKGILNSAGLIIEENSWPLKISGKND